LSGNCSSEKTKMINFVNTSIASTVDVDRGKTASLFSTQPPKIQLKIHNKKTTPICAR